MGTRWPAASPSGEGGRHWEWEGRYLGADEHGHWWHAPAGTWCARPGAEFVAPSAWVSLAPHTGAYAVGFYPEDREVSIYVDMTTEPVWQRRAGGASGASGAGGAGGAGDVGDDGGPPWEVTMVDLDLDVPTRDGHLYVDDEDEFAEHQVELAYPAQVVALAERWRDIGPAAYGTWRFIRHRPWVGTRRARAACVGAGAR